MDDARDRAEPALGGTRLARALALLLGAACAAVSLTASGRHGWRRLEVHGDGTEFLLAAAHLDRCTQREGPDPSMSPWPFESARANPR